MCTASTLCRTAIQDTQTLLQVIKYTLDMLFKAVGLLSLAGAPALASPFSLRYEHDHYFVESFMKLWWDWHGLATLIQATLVCSCQALPAGEDVHAEQLTPGALYRLRMLHAFRSFTRVQLAASAYIPCFC